MTPIAVAARPHARHGPDARRGHDQEVASAAQLPQEHRGGPALEHPALGDHPGGHRTPSPPRAGDRTSSDGGAPRRRGCSPRPPRRRAPRRVAAARRRAAVRRRLATEPGATPSSTALAASPSASKAIVTTLGSEVRPRYPFGATATGLRQPAKSTPPDGAGERPAGLAAVGGAEHEQVRAGLVDDVQQLLGACACGEAPGLQPGSRIRAFAEPRECPLRARPGRFDGTQTAVTTPSGSLRTPASARASRASSVPSYPTMMLRYIASPARRQVPAATGSSMRSASCTSRVE